jgi:Coenzyme PQQ synthesis protein D (PqqD)
VRRPEISEHRYRANRPQVVDEIVDDEALLIDLTTGAYFSATGAGAVAWNGAAAGKSAEEIAAGLVEQFSIEEADAQRDVAAFLGELVAEGLLVEDPARTPDAAGDVPVTTTRGYQAPVLEKYTDLSDLILLDPVHDVSEAGWPQRQPNP